MRLAISGEVPAKKYNMDQFLELVSALGVRAIEIWPENIPFLKNSDGLFRSYKNRDFSAAHSLLKKWGVEVACVSFGGAFDTIFTDDPSFYVAELIEAVHAAGTLGAGFVNSYLYHLSMVDEPDYEYLANLYLPAVREAEKEGVTILLENEAHDSTKNPEVMKKIVETVDNSHFRVNFDAVNYYQSSFEPFPYSFNVLKDIFSYIHIKDGCVYDKNNCMHSRSCVGGYMTGANKGNYIYYPLMGNGMMNIPAEIRALEMMGYDGWVTIEPHVPVDLWGLYIAHEVHYLNAFGIK